MQGLRASSTITPMSNSVGFFIMCLQVLSSLGQRVGVKVFQGSNPKTFILEYGDFSSQVTEQWARGFIAAIAQTKQGA